MKKFYAKSLKEYEGPQELHSKKKLAENLGIPYQVLIRVFILDGLDRYKKVS